MAVRPILPQVISNVPGPPGAPGTDGVAPPSWAIAATRGSNGKDMLVTAGGNAVTVHYSHKTRTRTNLRLLYGNYYTNDNAGDTVPNVTLTVAASITVDIHRSRVRWGKFAVISRSSSWSTNSTSDGPIETTW